MKASLQIGRLAGIPIQFHWSFLLVFVWMLASSWQPGQGINVSTLQWLSVWVGLVFLAVVLHELGHALMARRMGIDTRKIVLYPLGGGAFLERIPTEPKTEIWVAVAGPLVNLLLALLMVPLIWWQASGMRLQLMELILSPYSNIVLYDIAWWEYSIVVFFLLNMLLAIFNLLPAYPLDGGRVLRAGLSWLMPRRKATILAAAVGLLFALAFLAIAYLSNDWMFAIGAALVGLLAFAEMRSQRAKERLANALVQTHYQPDFQRLYLGHDQTVEEIQQHILDWQDAPIILIDNWQQAHAVTTKSAILAKEMTPYAGHLFRSVVGPADWIGLSPTENLLRAAEKFDKEQIHAMPVINRYGHIIGILDRQTVREVSTGKNKMVRK